MNMFSSPLQRRQWLVASAAFFLIPASWAQTAGYKTIDWNDLMPDDWVKEMTKEMAKMSKLNGMQDGSAEATKAMADLRKRLDDAPIVKAQVNQKIRIPGYAVPLDADRTNSKREFLLVPYFGACIHTPPPPSNQIVLVRPTASSKIKKMPESMDVLWVEGELKEARVNTSQGVSGYMLEAINIAPYEAKPAKR